MRHSAAAVRAAAIRSRTPCRPTMSSPCRSRHSANVRPTGPKPESTSDTCDAAAWSLITWMLTLRQPFWRTTMTVFDSPIPRFHLAMPVDDLDAAKRFYGEVLGLEQGRSADNWVDWNLSGHQFVTH